MTIGWQWTVIATIKWRSRFYKNTMYILCWYVGPLRRSQTTKINVSGNARHNPMLFSDGQLQGYSWYIRLYSAVAMAAVLTNRASNDIQLSCTSVHFPAVSDHVAPPPPLPSSGAAVSSASPRSSGKRRRSGFQEQSRAKNLFMSTATEHAAVAERRLVTLATDSEMAK